MKDVVSIGILVADVISKPVTSLPEKGTLMPIDSISLHSGGCALSSAVDMSIIGLDTAVVGKIGDDGFGAYLTSVLKKACVETKALAIGANCNTSASVVVVGNDSERSFIHCFGANGEFCYEDIDFEDVENTPYTSYITESGSASLTYDLTEKDKLTFSLQGVDYTSKNDLITYQLFTSQIGVDHKFSETLSSDFVVGISRLNATNLTTQTFDFFGQPVTVTQSIDSERRGSVYDAGLTQLLESGPSRS